MPTIPDFTALGLATPQPQLTQFVPTSNAGERIGEGVGELAGAVGQAGAAIRQKQRADAITAASQQLTDFRIANQAALDQAKQNANPQQLSSFAPGVLQDFDTRAEALIKNANPLAQQYLQAGINDERARLGVGATQWADTQRTAYNAQSVLGNLDKLTPLVTADPSRQLDIGGQLLAQVNASGLPPAQQAELRTHVTQSLNMAAIQGNVQRDPLTTFNQLNDPNNAELAGLTPQQRAGLQSYARAQLVDSQATGLAQVFANGGAQAGTRALAALDQNADLPPDVRDDVRQRVNGLVNQLRDDRRNQYTQQLAQLEQHIATGQAGPDDRAAAWDLYNKNALDPSQLTATLGTIYRSELKQASDGAALQAVTDAYTNRQPLDPKDPDAKAGVSALFSQLTTGAQPGSPGYVNRAVDIASRTGVVPDPAISWARSNLVSGDPNAAAQSADLIARLEESIPRAAGFALDDRTRAIADTISSAVRAGTPAPIAVDIARKNATLSPAEATDLKQRWQTLKVDTTQGGALQSLLKGEPQFKGGFLSSVPDVPAQMQGDFDAATRRYFDYTGGNLDQARELAARDVSRVWGVTEVNGKREIMPYAPEAMFPGLTTDMVRDDVDHTVQTSAQAFHTFDPATGKLTSSAPDPDDVRLIPTDRTARTGGLEWNLGAPDQLGAMDVLRGADGNPLVYRLPVSSTDFDAVRDRMAQAALDRARVHQQDAQAVLDAQRQEFEAEPQ